MNATKFRSAAVLLMAGGLLAWGTLRSRAVPPNSMPTSPSAAVAADATVAAEAADVARAAEEMARAANNFWDALTPEQQAKATFDLKDDERENWHFIPKPRKGLTWKEMSPSQQALGHAFLSSGLSGRGYRQAMTIMSLEQVLKDLENGKGPARDAELYYFSVFGKPGPHETWGWRVEGHHLSLNFTIVDGRSVAAGPIFMGSNPGEIRQGPRKGLRVLGETEDMGRRLVKSLSDEQRKTAIINAVAPAEVITGNSRKANPGPAVGLPTGQMTADEREQLTALVEIFAHRLRPELAEQDLRQIRQAGWDKVYFAWAGGLEPGEKHYYRIQGPTFLVEYDNTQNDGNHVHTVWRDAANDFGEDLLRQHYLRDPHGQPATSATSAPTSGTH